MIPYLLGWPSSCRAVYGSVGQCTTFRCVWYRWCTTGIVGGARRLGSISGAGGFARRLCCGCGRCALVAYFPGVRVWSHAFASVALRAVWCCVCRFVSAAPARLGCFLSLLAAWGLVCVLLFLRCWSALVGRLSVSDCAFWGFLLSFALLHLLSLLRHFVTRLLHNEDVTKRRDG